MPAYLMAFLSFWSPVMVPLEPPRLSSWLLDVYEMVFPMVTKGERKKSGRVGGREIWVLCAGLQGPSRRSRFFMARLLRWINIPLLQFERYVCGLPGMLRPVSFNAVASSTA